MRETSMKHDSFGFNINRHLDWPRLFPLQQILHILLNQSMICGTIKKLRTPKNVEPKTNTDY